MNHKLLISFMFFLYSLQSYSKLVVISDIDDTIKMSNSMGKIGGAYHFLRKVPYLEMRDLYQEINHFYGHSNEEVKFFYVSAAPAKLFKASKWLYKHDFPYGQALLKVHKESTYDFKYKTIKKILTDENASDLKVMMFGDNAQVDQVVYHDLKRDLALNAEIYIRDVRAEATYFSPDVEVVKLPDTTYYFSEIELFKSFNFLSSDLLNQVEEEYKSLKLIPKYTLKTLEKRIALKCKKFDLSCREKAENLAFDFWNDYYSRF